jgi:hypothetical protein
MARLDYRGSKQFTEAVIDELSAAVDVVTSRWQDIKTKLNVMKEARTS